MTPRPLWATVEWGGRRIESASNIVFTNGLLDPWYADLCDVHLKLSTALCGSCSIHADMRALHIMQVCGHISERTGTEIFPISPHSCCISLKISYLPKFQGLEVWTRCMTHANVAMQARRWSIEEYLRHPCSCGHPGGCTPPGPHVLPPPGSAQCLGYARHPAEQHPALDCPSRGKAIKKDKGHGTARHGSPVVHAVASAGLKIS